MKTLFNFINRTSICLLFASFPGNLNAQQVNGGHYKTDAAPANLDTNTTSTALLLNPILFSPDELEHYRGMQAFPQQHEMNPEAWESLYRRLSACPISTNKNISFPPLGRTSPDSLTQSNVIEIGIIDVEATPPAEQPSANHGNFANREQNTDASSNANVRFLAASLLRDDIFQADVRFRISPLLLMTNQQHRASAIELDFGDGLGYLKFNLGEQLIAHRFGRAGKHSILMKLHTSGGIYCFRSIIEVVQMERKKPFREFKISALPIVEDTTTYNTPRGRLVASIPGAKVRVVLGCDQVYDKPIVIVEGLDMGENVNLDRLEATWTGRSTPVMEHYLAEGYDLVFVDWQNSKDYIQNNAQVLKDIIEDVNQTKIGNNPIIVIGTSMGGLVARWALREMEVQSTPHNVNLLICYDTPHQGANIPIGLTQLYWETPLDVFENLVKNALPKNLYEMYMALPSPSPRQLLMHWGGQTNVGVGNKHPDFVTFRNALTALGNGGYPATCRNVAMINGSMDASDQSIFTDFNYGDRIMAGWIPGFTRNTMFDIRTNSINAGTYVTRLAIFQVPPKFPTFLLKNIPLNISTNDDFVPGGRQSIENRVFPWLSTATFAFSFVPTFSSIDYLGATDIQEQRLQLNATAVNAVTGPNRQTPFAAIYGNQNNINTPHIDPILIPWLQMGVQEGLLTASGCGESRCRLFLIFTSVAPLVTLLPTTESGIRLT